MKLPTLPEIKKALGALGVVEGAAVGYGLLDKAQAGYVTAALGVLTAGVVYLLDNKPAKPHLDPADGTGTAAPLNPPAPADPPAPSV